MQPLTLKKFDSFQIERLFNLYMMDNGIQDADELVSRLQSNVIAQADMWGLNYGNEVQNAN
jgi:hypothetical protein